MNIVVCIKQVPDVDDIKWTKENNLDRANMLSKINPHDEWALDWAVKIKSKCTSAYITVISMGPNQAKDILSYAIAKGADRALLLSDKAFAGSDTLVTAKILARAIQKYIGNFSIILTGQLACDGDTAQVPVSLAQMLEIIDATNLNEIINIGKDKLIVSQKIINEINHLEVSFPCLLAINAPTNQPYKPKIEDYIKAQNHGIETYTLNDLDFEKNQVGIIGSPTMVWKAFRPESKRNSQEIKENYTDKIIELLLKVK